MKQSSKQLKDKQPTDEYKNN